MFERTALRTNDPPPEDRFPCIRTAAGSTFLRKGRRTATLGSATAAKPRSREKSHLVIGPWEHRVSRKTGDLDFGPDARVEREVFELPWFDYWLKGVGNGVGSAPPATLFVMGKNVWRQKNEFSLARTQYRKM
jgi:predicted acyl esterase